MRLYNNQTQAWEEVEDTDVQSSIVEQSHSFLTDEKVPVLVPSSDGSGQKPVRLDPQDAATFMAKHGGKWMSGEDVTSWEEKEKFSEGYVPAAIALGLLDAATLTVGSRALQAMGAPIQQIREHNPASHLATDILASLALSVAAVPTGGATAPLAAARAASAGGKIAKILGFGKKIAPYTGAGRAAIIGKKTQDAVADMLKVGENASNMRKTAVGLASRMAGVAPETFLFGAGYSLSEADLGNPLEAAEHILWEGSKSAIFGVGITGALAPIIPAAIGGGQKIVNMIGAPINLFAESGLARNMENRLVNAVGDFKNWDEGQRAMYKEAISISQRAREGRKASGKIVRALASLRDYASGTVDLAHATSEEIKMLEQLGHNANLIKESIKQATEAGTPRASTMELTEQLLFESKFRAPDGTDINRKGFLDMARDQINQAIKTRQGYLAGEELLVRNPDIAQFEEWLGVLDRIERDFIKDWVKIGKEIVGDITPEYLARFREEMIEAGEVVKYPKDWLLAEKVGAIGPIRMPGWKKGRTPGGRKKDAPEIIWSDMVWGYEKKVKTKPKKAAPGSTLEFKAKDVIEEVSPEQHRKEVMDQIGKIVRIVSDAPPTSKTGRVSKSMDEFGPGYLDVERTAGTFKLLEKLSSDVHRLTETGGLDQFPGTQQTADLLKANITDFLTGDGKYVTNKHSRYSAWGRMAERKAGINSQLVELKNRRTWFKNEFLTENAKGEWVVNPIKVEEYIQSWTNENIDVASGELIEFTKLVSKTADSLMDTQTMPRGSWKRAATPEPGAAGPAIAAGADRVRMSLKMNSNTQAMSDLVRLLGVEAKPALDLQHAISRDYSSGEILKIAPTPIIAGGLIGGATAGVPGAVVGAGAGALMSVASDAMLAPERFIARIRLFETMAEHGKKAVDDGVNHYFNQFSKAEQIMMPLESMRRTDNLKGKLVRYPRFLTSNVIARHVDPSAKGEATGEPGTKFGREEYENARTIITALHTNQESRDRIYEHAFSSLEGVAPKLQDAMKEHLNNYIKDMYGSMPQPHDMGPLEDPEPPSDQEIHEWGQRLSIQEYGIHAILRGMQAGNITQSEIEEWRQSHPSQYRRFASRVLEIMADKAKRESLPASARAMLLDVAGIQVHNPAHIAKLQDTFAKMEEAKQQATGPQSSLKNYPGTGSSGQSFTHGVELRRNA